MPWPTSAFTPSTRRCGSRSPTSAWWATTTCASPCRAIRAGQRRRATEHVFTGIIEELGTVAGIEQQGDAIRLTIEASTVLGDAGLGDSIAVNGCCLTVAEISTSSTGEGTWT